MLGTISEVYGVGNELVKNQREVGFLQKTLVYTSLDKLAKPSFFKYFFVLED